MTERSLLNATRWLWIIGGTLVAGIGILLLALFIADSFEVLIAGIGGVLFLVSGVVAVLLGVRGIVRHTPK